MSAPEMKKTKPGITGRINPAIPKRISRIPTDILEIFLIISLT